MTLSQKVHWGLKGSGIVALAAIAFASSTRGMATNREGSPAPKCDLVCAQGVYPCPQTFHEAHDTRYGETSNGASDPNPAHPDQCFSIYCNDAHYCVPDPGQLIVEAASAVDGADSKALRRLLSQNKAVVISEQRGAIQVLGCSGAVIANFPVSERLLDQLAGSH